MNFIKNILGRILALWTLLLFGITILLILPFIWVTGLWKEPDRSYRMHTVYRGWMRTFFFLSGIRLRVKGVENFKKGENYVVVYNHNSFVDVFVSVPFMPGANKTIAKIEMSRIPLFGMVYKRGSVLVDRRNEESRKKSYGEMKDVLAMGLHMCIYPEGTRNKTNQPLQRFHDGAFRLAMDSGKSILPGVIFNSAKVLPRKTFYWWPAKVDLHYLPPIAPRDFSTVDALKQHVFDVMRDYYVSERQEEF